MRAEQFFFGNPFESEFDLPPGFMGGVAVQEQEEQEQKQEQTPDIDAYLDALREGTGDYTSTLQTDLVEQGYLPDITVIGEGGAYGTEFDPESAMASVPVGSLENYDFGSFTFDKNLEDFGGTFGYGSLTNEQLQSFQNELLPIMAKEVAKQQTEGRQDYQSALMKAYQFNPEVQAIYEKYGVSPIRTSDEYGSVKLYDPFSFNEITLTDNRPGFDEYAAPAIKAFINWATGQALGQLAGAAGDALFGDIPLFGEETIDVKIDEAGNITTATDTSGVTTVGDVLDVFKGGATSSPATGIASDGATGGFAGPLNMLTGALAIKDAVDTAQATEDAPDFASDEEEIVAKLGDCLLYTSPSPRDGLLSRMPSSA